MTAKTLRTKRGIDFTRGFSRAERVINRRNKRESLTSSGSDRPKRSRLKALCVKMKKAKELWEARLEQERVQLEDLFGKLPDRVDRDSTFEERSFGSVVRQGEKYYRASGTHLEDLSSIVVSLGLFDGDEMLFACSGIPIPDGRTRLHLTRFVTSACLVAEFHNHRNRDDALRVEVCLPHNKFASGFLELYDKDIAIVTCYGHLNVWRVDLDLEPKAPPAGSGDTTLVAGRAFHTGSLMTADGRLTEDDAWVSSSQNFSKAVLGGPLIGKDWTFLGMIFDHSDGGDDATVRYAFLPKRKLYERLNHFQILDQEVRDFRRYSLPKGVSQIVPSGYWNAFNRLKFLGYPMPPPLVVEFNGEMVNEFEGLFGDARAWKGFPFGEPYKFDGRVWTLLRKKVVTNISRRVVSLASFNGNSRHFVCTGLLIKWHGNRASHTVVLTSASLVRIDNEDKIPKDLRIEVFLPPNQRREGILELCNLNYNIAVVSVTTKFRTVRPENIFNEVKKSPKQVIAVARDAEHGLLMGSIGEIKSNDMDSKLDCKDLQISTCKIKKVGIGGPLITLDGTFVGMNFYDGRKVTPFLPKSKIVEVLDKLVKHPPPSESLLASGSVHVQEDGEGTTKNRWPVPMPYWFHGGLDLDRSYVPRLRGRTLH